MLGKIGRGGFRNKFECQITSWVIKLPLDTARKEAKRERELTSCY